jgi:hypothetical protein
MEKNEALASFLEMDLSELNESTWTAARVSNGPVYNTIKGMVCCVADGDLLPEAPAERAINFNWVERSAPEANAAGFKVYQHIIAD